MYYKEDYCTKTTKKEKQGKPNNIEENLYVSYSFNLLLYYVKHSTRIH